jgi:hypothetical protein
MVLLDGEDLKGLTRISGCVTVEMVDNAGVMSWTRLDSPVGLDHPAGRKSGFAAYWRKGD